MRLRDTREFSLAALIVAAGVTFLAGIGVLLAASYIAVLIAR